MDQIAVINIRNGEVKPHGQRTLTDTDKVEIARWMEDRKALLAQRDIDDIHRAVDYLNVTTQWAQSKASDEQLEDVTDRLLMAMHGPAIGSGPQKVRPAEQGLKPIQPVRRFHAQTAARIGPSAEPQRKPAR